MDTSFMLRTRLQKSSGVLTAIGAVSIVAYDGTRYSGDVDGDGAIDLVGRTFIARLVGGAWTVSGLNVFDLARAWATWMEMGCSIRSVSASPIGRRQSPSPRGVQVDVGIAGASPPPPVLPGMEVQFPFTVTNNGHATADGLGVAVVDTPDATVRVSCPSGDCTSTVLAPAQSVVVTASLCVPAGDTTVQATVCGGYPDPVAANDAASGTLATRPTADVSTLFTFDVQNARSRTGWGWTTPVPSPRPTSASTSTCPRRPPSAPGPRSPRERPARPGAGLLSCALARLDSHASWTVTGAGRLRYHGQAFTGTADARSDVEDPNLSNNHYAIEICGLRVRVGRTDLGLASDVADGTAVLTRLGVLCVAIAVGHHRPSRRAQPSPQRRPRST